MTKIADRVFSPKKCPQCGKTFIPAGPRQRYCCRQHRDLDYYLANRDRYKKWHDDYMERLKSGEYANEHVSSKAQTR